MLAFYRSMSAVFAIFKSKEKVEPIEDVHLKDEEYAAMFKRSFKQQTATIPVTVAPKEDTKPIAEAPRYSFIPEQNLNNYKKKQEVRISRSSLVKSIDCFSLPWDHRVI